jgi:hypothetical protein
MPVPLYLDVHVPLAIAEQLRRRGVDVVHAIEEGTDRLADEELLEVARQQGRVLFAQDIRFRVMAEDWQREGRAFAGLLYGHQLGATIGQYVLELELIAKASEPSEWVNAVQHIPL